ncbi:hypothetical protein Hanom_Chr08g00685211 [Helianthus anomalus]
MIGTDFLTDILYRYLGRGPITDISLIYRLIYRDINYIDYYYYVNIYSNNLTVFTKVQKISLFSILLKI